MYHLIRRADQTLVPATIRPSTDADKLLHERNGMMRFNGRDREGLARYRFTEDAAHAFLTNLVAEGLVAQ